MALSPSRFTLGFDRAATSEAAANKNRLSLLRKGMRSAKRKGDYKAALAFSDEMSRTGAPAGTTGSAEDTASIARGRVAAREALSNQMRSATAPTREGNIAAARAAGTFDATRAKFNEANKGKKVMDEAGNIADAPAPKTRLTPDEIASAAEQGRKAGEEFNKQGQQPAAEPLTTPMSSPAGSLPPLPKLGPDSKPIESNLPQPAGGTAAPKESLPKLPPAPGAAPAPAPTASPAAPAAAPAAPAAVTPPAPAARPSAAPAKASTPGQPDLNAMRSAAEKAAAARRPLAEKLGTGIKNAVGSVVETLALGVPAAINEGIPDAASAVKRGLESTSGELAQGVNNLMAPARGVIYGSPMQSKAEGAYQQALAERKRATTGPTLNTALSPEEIKAALAPAKGPAVAARAKGGPVKAGKPYLVGEEGPEIVVPKEDGKVIPNDKLRKKSRKALRKMLSKR